MEAHRDHFLSDFNQNDLGAFRYAEKVICTSHSAAFSLGAPSRLFLDEADYMKSLTTDLGRYIALWGATITPSASFLDHVDNDLVELDGDCSSKSVYASIFNESGPEELNGFLLALQGIMNFSTTLLSLDQNEESFYTIFKMRFLTLYSTVRSIQALIGFRSPDVPISAQSQLFMRRILSLPLAKLIVHDEKVAGLRRSLMHYKPDDQFTSSLSMSEPIYGILNATFLDLRFDEAVSSIYSCADDTSSLFEEWASRSSLQHHS